MIFNGIFHIQRRFLKRKKFRSKKFVANPLPAILNFFQRAKRRRITSINLTARREIWRKVRFALTLAQAQRTLALSAASLRELFGTRRLDMRRGNFLSRFMTITSFLRAKKFPANSTTKLNGKRLLMPICASTAINICPI